MAETLLERLGLRPEEVVLVGDRLSTDVRMARAAGMAAALVLTGATSAEEAIQAADPPDLVVDDVTGLLDGRRRRERELHEARRR
jgi:NagD protein